MNCSFCSDTVKWLTACDKCEELVCEKCLWETNNRTSLCTGCMTFGNDLYKHIFNELFFKGVDVQQLRGQSKNLKISTEHIPMSEKRKKKATVPVTTEPVPSVGIPTTDITDRDDIISKVKVLKSDYQMKVKDIKHIRSEISELEKKLYN